MSLSKDSTVSKKSKSYDLGLKDVAAKNDIFNLDNIILVVNPELDKISTSRKPTPKAEAAKKMFDNYYSNK